LPLGIFAWFLAKFRTPQTEYSSNSTNDEDTAESTSKNGGTFMPTSSVRVIVERLPSPSKEKASREARKEGREKLNLGAQIVTAILVFVYAGVAILQLCEMRSATNTAKLALEAQTRPWIGIELEIVNNEVANFQIKFHVRNYGQSPAIIGSPAFEFISAHPFAGRSTAFFNEHKMCDKSERDLSETNSSRINSTVFPGKDGTSPQQISVPPSVFPYDVTMAIGCIAYRGPTGSGYWTQVLYDVRPWHENGNWKAEIRHPISTDTR